jgi:hypothetical protein
MKRQTAFFLLFLSVTTSFGQQKGFSIGTKRSGFGFGNFETYSGIRLYLFDKYFKTSNGINLGLYSEGGTSNGVTFSLLQNLDNKLNGLGINLLGGENKIANGIVISGLGQVCNNFKGIGFGGLGFCGDTLSGLLISPIGMTWWNNNRIKQINGLTIGGICGANTDNMNGLSIALFNNSIDTLNGVSIAITNYSKELTGVQIGLWNVAENNKILKRMPIINFNFRRKASR